jgi:hypothetical protein
MTRSSEGRRPGPGEPVRPSSSAVLASPRLSVSISGVIADDYGPRSSSSGRYTRQAAESLMLL